MAAFTLEDYLIQQGMRADKAAEIWQAYSTRQGPAFDAWVRNEGLAPEAVANYVRSWAAALAEDGPQVIEVRQELVAVRSGCIYRAVTHQPTTGRGWFVQARSLSFPGQMADRPQADRAEPVAIVAAEVDEAGRFIWLTLTPCAKDVFGALLLDSGVELNQWTWIQEFDLWRREQLPAEPGDEGGATDPPEEPDPQDIPI